MTDEEIYEKAKRITCAMGGDFIFFDITASAMRMARDDERARCAAIVQLAREGEIDADLRSIIHRIKNPPSTRKELIP